MLKPWLAAHLPADAAAEALTLADAEASRWSGIALVAQMSPPAARQLRECGLSDEHAALGSAQLLPLLGEMVGARAVGSHAAVAALRPADDGVPPGVRALLPSDGAAPPSALLPPTAPPVVLLVVARYQEDVGWLERLPAGVAYHVMQKGGALQAELPAERQSLLPNVGRESHSYLRFLAERAHGDDMPPLLVCTQADPFPHNDRFLEELQLLAAAAAASDAASAASADAEARLPPFVPLGRWSGGERLIVCDTSGAPHQPKLLPLHRTWRSLFGDETPVPLWLRFTPGALFAVSRDACRSRPADFYARASEACGLAASADPICGHAFERLWWYVFDRAAHGTYM